MKCHFYIFYYLQCFNFIHRYFGNFHQMEQKSVTSDSRMRVFEQCYRMCCKSKNIVPLKNLIFKKKAQVLDFCVDRIKQSHWEPILIALSDDLSLHCLIIRCRIQGKNVLEHIDSERLVKSVTKSPVILTKFMLCNLTYAVSHCLSQTSVMTVLQLEGLPLNISYLGPIIEALRVNDSLKHIGFQGCSIGDLGCQKICEALRYRIGVVTVNFSGCDLTSQGAFHVAELIKTQKIYRYSENWQQSLRYQSPNLESMPGTRGISLSGNPEMGDEGFVHLVDVLLDDLWIYALDMQQCGLTEISIQNCIRLFEYNTTLRVLDLKNNPMISNKSLSSVNVALHRNAHRASDKPLWLPDSSHLLNNNRNRFVNVVVPEKTKPAPSKAKSLYQTLSDNNFMNKSDINEDKKCKELHTITVLKKQLKEEKNHRQQLEVLNQKLFEQVKDLKKLQIKHWKTVSNNNFADAVNNSQKKMCPAHSLPTKKVECVTAMNENKDKNGSDERFVNVKGSSEVQNTSFACGDVNLEEIKNKICSGAEILERMLARRAQSMSKQTAKPQDGFLSASSDDSIRASSPRSIEQIDVHSLFESTSENATS